MFENEHRDPNICKSPNRAGSSKGRKSQGQLPHSLKTTAPISELVVDQKV